MAQHSERQVAGADWAALAAENLITASARLMEPGRSEEQRQAIWTTQLNGLLATIDIANDFDFVVTLLFNLSTLNAAQANWMADAQGQPLQLYLPTLLERVRQARIASGGP